MTDHHVRSLRLHLRSHGSPPVEMETEARNFSERLLTAITERLDARANGKLVLVRRLPIRIRARRELFVDRMELERIADDIAASITLEQRSERAADDDDVAVFDDETSWRTAYLVERGEGRAPTAWWFSALAAEADGVAGLTTLSRADATRTVTSLARAGVLAPLLATLADATIERLISVLEIAAAEVWHHDATMPLRAARVRSILACATRELPAGVRPSAAFEATSSPATPPIRESEQAAMAVHRTRYGGLVYVVRSLIELDTGEVLWRACLSEPVVIASALAAIAGDSDDEGPMLLGGASCRERFEASPAQREEIVLALTTNLFAALPRRGLADPPEIVLQFIESHGRRVLAGFLGEFPMFAAPATAIAEARAALDELVERCSSASLVSASPIAELHPHVETRAIETQRSVPLRSDLSLDAALIVAVTAGCAAALVYARAGELALAGNARIHDEGDRRIVTMAMDAIHLGIRRAGLDRDPGWIPWLQRHLLLVFEE